jgi:ribulose-phosphate 3-epimerase
VSIRLAPSILSADFASLGSQIRTVEEAGAHLLHVDVMDGHFVPNLTIGPPVVKSIRKATRMPLDVHLMISDPDKYIPAFVDAGANMLTVHAEATVHLDRTLNFIRYTLDKIRKARQVIEDKNYRCVIEVDGGIDTNNLAEVIQAGAEVLVAGSAIFHAPDPARKVKEMLEIAASVGYHSKYV